MALTEQHETVILTVLTIGHEGHGGKRAFSFLLSTCQFNCQDMDTEEDFSN